MRRSHVLSRYRIRASHGKRSTAVSSDFDENEVVNPTFHFAWYMIIMRALDTFAYSLLDTAG